MAVRNVVFFPKRRSAQGLRAEGCEAEAQLVTNGFTWMPAGLFHLPA